MLEEYLDKFAAEYNRTSLETAANFAALLEILILKGVVAEDEWEEKHAKWLAVADQKQSEKLKTAKEEWEADTASEEGE